MPKVWDLPFVKKKKQKTYNHVGPLGWLRNEHKTKNNVKKKQNTEFKKI